MATNKCWGLVILAVGVGFGCGLLWARPSQQKMKATIATLRAEANEAVKDLQEAEAEIASLQYERDLAKAGFEQAENEKYRIIENLREWKEVLTTKAKDEKHKRNEYMIKTLKSVVEFKPERTSLIDLEGVNVQICPVTLGEGMYGLSTQALQNDTEFLLRRNGIKVLSEKEWLQAPGCPFLLINVFPQIKSERLGIAWVNIDMSLSQAVSLVREPKIKCVATTWSKRSRVERIKVDNGNVENAREKLKDYVNEFINDYLAANPKK